ncbi:MAG: 4-hydroxythreonine-4-phosphate dehydrogenase PdxA [Acidobacteria bacterium]|nr:4-hydroxythreonine-4-phosphate dehydrogenase PdxA [Acidobacteriota bacterium]MBI3487612.1 4-hydroxythreonine-4-phosphate dehydrogenase PdxA [Acidobacteriota bacterium]
MSRRPRLAISLGDPCGIGPELLLTSLPALLARAEATVVGCRAGLDLLEDLPGAPVSWRWIESPAQAPTGFQGQALRLQVSAPAPDDRLLAEVLWLDPTPEITRGQLCLGAGSAASGRATVEAIRVAALMTMAGLADALVTLPMAKSAAHLAGYDIPGHTEYLQHLSDAPMTRMAFVSPRLNVVLHTVHQSLRSVVESLDADAVAETLVFSTDQFIRLTGKKDLRVALCALNPHAGEEGAFGQEERLLEDALAQAEAAFLDFTPGPGRPVTGDPGEDQPKPHSPGQRGLEVLIGSGAGEGRPAPVFFGPLPSDSIFQRASKGEFDLVVALYHDQGLIPVKLLEPTRAVNLTLGLPFIRTSPDHGTAFDKAGKWIAEAENFMEAAALAVRLAGREGLPVLSPRG